LRVFAHQLLCLPHLRISWGEGGTRLSNHAGPARTQVRQLQGR
jgi:hypothetical protein